MSVRSARLAFGVSGTANTNNTIYTCPAGKTAVVKDVRVVGRAAGSTNYLLASSSGPTFTYLVAGALASGAVASTTGFIVLEPGDRLVVNASAVDAIGFHVSGAELDGVAP